LLSQLDRCCPFAEESMSLVGSPRQQPGGFVLFASATFHRWVERARSTVSEANPEPAGIMKRER
jgi:hypothetical protein